MPGRSAIDVAATAFGSLALLPGITNPTKAELGPIRLFKKISRLFQILSGGYSVLRWGATLSRIFGSAANERRFKQEERTYHRSEYRRAMLASSPTPRG